MTADISFSRHILKLTHRDVMAGRPHIKVSDAWVHDCGHNHWEFHFPELIEQPDGTVRVERFYWHGRAGNAYEARTRGWQAFLESKAVKS